MQADNRFNWPFSPRDSRWPWAVVCPGLPQIRTCAPHASGSSGHGVAAQREPADAFGAIFSVSSLNGRTAVCSSRSRAVPRWSRPGIFWRTASARRSRKWGAASRGADDHRRGRRTKTCTQRPEDGNGGWRGSHETSRSSWARGNRCSRSPRRASKRKSRSRASAAADATKTP